jgi:hypothetical protein
MGVIGFIRVSLGSSTVQLNDSLGSRRARPCSKPGFSNQIGDRGCGVYHRRAVVCFLFFFFFFFLLWAKGLNAMDVRILFTVGSVCRVKRFTTGWQTFR